MSDKVGQRFFEMLYLCIAFKMHERSKTKLNLI